MMLVNYSSSSDSEEEKSIDRIKISRNEENSTSRPIRLKLPQATSLLGKRKRNEVHDDVFDDTSMHEGRIRSFKHERGNWATHVYIPVENNIIEDIQDICLLTLDKKHGFKASTKMHISLSKTVVLQYHFIESFIDSLQIALQAERSFAVSFKNLNVYTNAERTRTFLALKMDDLYFKNLLNTLNKIDNVMKEFKLSTFYEKPSFHVSVLWCVGDYVNLINSLIPSLVESLAERLPLYFKIKEIHCKSGFKQFTFKLKK